MIANYELIRCFFDYMNKKLYHISIEECNFFWDINYYLCDALSNMEPNIETGELKQLSIWMKPKIKYVIGARKLL